MNEQLQDILDLPVLQTMLDRLWRASGIPFGLIDSAGEILVENGWQKICREYHSRHPEVGQRCLLNWLKKRGTAPGGPTGRDPFEFCCANGLVTIGQQIFYQDHCLGTLYVGQLLYEPPDAELFRKQAAHLGFDPKEYLAYLAEVPVVPKAKAREYLAFHAIQVQLLSEAGMRKLREEKARKALEESEQVFRSLFENAKDGIGIVTLDGTILEVNPSVCQLLSYGHEELLGRNIKTLADPAAGKRIPARIAQIVSEGSALFETRLLHKSGQPLSVEINTRLINYHGQQALLGNLRDLTERKEAEKALRVSESRFRTIFEAAAVGMATTYADGSFAQVNPHLCSFLGYTRDELLKLKVTEITAPEDLDKSRRMVQEVTEGKHSFIDIEKRYLRKDGATVWGRVTAAALPIENASSIATVAMIQDVTQRKIVEEALLESEQRFRSVINSTPLGIHLYTLEEDGRLIFTGYNPAADAILEIDNSQFLGLEFCEAFPGAADTDLPGQFRQVCITGEPWQTQQFAYADAKVSGVFEIHAFRPAAKRIAIMFMDVTQRMRAADAVRTSEATLRSILTAAPMSIGLVRNRVFCWVSRRMMEELGYAENELIGQKASMLYESKEEFERVGREKYSEVVNGRMGEVQTRWVRKDGEVLDVLLRSMPIDAENLEKGVIFTALNISGLIRSTMELHAKEEQVRLLLQSSGEAIYGLDGNGKCTFVNTMCLELLGYSDEHEVLGKSTHLLFHHTRLDGTPHTEADCEILKAFTLGEAVHAAQDVFWRQDGTSFPVEYSSYPIVKDEDIVGSVVTFNDITERQLAENALRQALVAAQNSREQVAAILRSAADALIVVDLDGRIVMFNQAADRLLNQHDSLVEGASIEQMTADKVFSERVRATLSGRAFPRPYDVVFADGRGGFDKILEARLAPMQGVDEAINGAVVTMRDVTREREIDRLKDDFISTAAHELRTPLTSIQGYSELMLDSLETFTAEQVRDFLAIIHERSQALSRITGDMLDLSRVQSGRLITINPFPGDLGVMLKHAMQSYKHKDDKYRFSAVIPDDLPKILFDADKIAQVLDNLISNAVKFSPRGGPITLSARAFADRVEVMVADEGIGMTAAVKGRVFEKFFRADTSNTGVSGLGLGMNLVKGIIEAHGGEIWVESQPGAGSTVAFSLPRGEDQ